MIFENTIIQLLRMDEKNTLIRVLWKKAEEDIIQNVSFSAFFVYSFCDIHMNHIKRRAGTADKVDMSDVPVFSNDLNGYEILFLFFP